MAITRMHFLQVRFSNRPSGHALSSYPTLRERDGLAGKHRPDGVSPLIEDQREVVIPLSGQIIRVHHHLDWIDPDTCWSGNSRVRCQGEPSCDASEDQRGSNNKQSAFSHLNSPVDRSSVSSDHRTSLSYHPGVAFHRLGIVCIAIASRQLHGVSSAFPRRLWRTSISASPLII
jgi:hypothetical protein